MRRKILILTIILSLLMATPAMAAITQVGDKKFEVSGYRVTFAAGQSGTTTIGGGKFQPAEAGGKYLEDVVLRTSNRLNSTNYITVTYDNGVTHRHEVESGTPTRISLHSYLTNYPSKGVTITFTSDGTRERWAEIIEFETRDAPGGHNPVDPGSGGGGGGGGTNPSPGNLGAYIDQVCGCITWSTPSGTQSFQIWKDGVLIDTLSRMATMYTPPTGQELGSYSIRAVDSSGNVIEQSTVNITSWGSGGGTPPPDPGGGTNPDPGGSNPDPDPGGGTNPGDECSPGCQAIIDALECPEFDEYLGRWASIIPPPPDWHQVAGIMRDTIVPAMGQEIVNRSPEVARIIADELQSREKRVQPPPSIPAYRTPEPMPVLRDIPAKIPFDVESGVPNFDPDYSESRPFAIPDPLSVQLDDTDSGYDYPSQTDDSSPDYQSVTRIDRDKGYQARQPQDTSSPAYETQDPTGDPAPEYYYINGGRTQVPIYKPRTTPDPSPNYNSGPNDPVPSYKLP